MLNVLLELKVHFLFFKSYNYYRLVIHIIILHGGVTYISMYNLLVRWLTQITQILIGLEMARSEKFITNFSMNQYSQNCCTFNGVIKMFISVICILFGTFYCQKFSFSVFGSVFCVWCWWQDVFSNIDVCTFSYYRFFLYYMDVHLGYVAFLFFNVFVLLACVLFTNNLLTADLYRYSQACEA